MHTCQAAGKHKGFISVPLAAGWMNSKRLCMPGIQVVVTATGRGRTTDLVPVCLSPELGIELSDVVHDHAPLPCRWAELLAFAPPPAFSLPALRCRPSFRIIFIVILLLDLLLSPLLRLALPGSGDGNRRAGRSRRLSRCLLGAEHAEEIVLVHAPLLWVDWGPASRALLRFDQA
jgi:hypothetical protein